MKYNATRALVNIQSVAQEEEISYRGGDVLDVVGRVHHVSARVGGNSCQVCSGR